MSVDYSAFVCFGVATKLTSDELDEILRRNKTVSYCSAGNAYSGRETTFVCLKGTYVSCESYHSTLPMPQVDPAELIAECQRLGIEHDAPRWLVGKRIW